MTRYKIYHLCWPSNDKRDLLYEFLKERIFATNEESYPFTDEDRIIFALKFSGIYELDEYDPANKKYQR